MQRLLYLCRKNSKMRIANKTLLDDFVQSHAQSAGPLNKWVEKVKGAKWTSHADLKQILQFKKEGLIWKRN